MLRLFVTNPSKAARHCTPLWGVLFCALLSLAALPSGARLIALTCHTLLCFAAAAATVAVRDLPHATISVKRQGQMHIPVADVSGPHFAVLKAALQQHWRLDTPGEPAVPVLPMLLPGACCRGVAFLLACWHMHQAATCW